MQLGLTMRGRCHMQARRLLLLLSELLAVKLIDGELNVRENAPRKSH